MIRCTKAAKPWLALQPGLVWAQVSDHPASALQAARLARGPASALRASALA